MKPKINAKTGKSLGNAWLNIEAYHNKPKTMLQKVGPIKGKSLPDPSPLQKVNFTDWNKWVSFELKSKCD